MDLRPQIFDGYDFEIWKEKMDVYLQGTDFDIWEMTTSKVTISKKTRTSQRKLELVGKATNILLCSLTPKIQDMVYGLSMPNDIWCKLEELFENVHHEFIEVNNDVSISHSFDLLQDKYNSLFANFEKSMALNVKLKRKLDDVINENHKHTLSLNDEISTLNSKLEKVVNDKNQVQSNFDKLQKEHLLVKTNLEDALKRDNIKPSRISVFKRLKSPSSKTSYIPVSKPINRQNRPKCFKCGKIGHTMGNCFHKSNVKQIWVPQGTKVDTYGPNIQRGPNRCTSLNAGQNMASKRQPRQNVAQQQQTQKRPDPQHQRKMHSNSVRKSWSRKNQNSYHNVYYDYKPWIRYDDQARLLWRSRTNTTINPHPPPAQIPPRSWNPNPNYNKDYYGNSNHGLDYDNNGPVGVKRMRFNNVNESYAGSLSEDERRLKLIRDHGAASHGLDRNYDGGYWIPNHSFEQSNFGGNRGNFGDHSQVIEGGYRREIQNYGERQFAYQHIGNSKNVELGRSLYNQNESNVLQNHGYGNSDYELPNQPPLPTTPPPPLPTEPPRFQFSESVVSSSASGPGSLFPVVVDSVSSFQSPYTKVSEAITSVSTHYPNSSVYYPTEIRADMMALSNSFKGESEKPSKDLFLDKPKVIDVSHILKHPHRANRPDHIVVILRGLPGSGKSYLAKKLRDLEVENGGSAPRIHSMDEYFITEVEKVEESEGSRSSGSVRGKKPVMKKVMEYCYEPEMEEAYRSSMLKAFKKTLDERAFPFVIVDDRNLRVADFAQFWATAKRSGYEVYLLEAAYKDPVGCAARNVHGFTQNEIHKMASQCEEAPSLYMRLDIKSLLHGDDLEENGIQEVDMDTEDGNYVGGPSGSGGTTIEKVARPSDGDLARDVPLKVEQKGDDAEEHQLEVVKELGKSKWSNDLDEDDLHKIEATRDNSTALSSLIKSYRKKGKLVRWADQIGRIGFSISAGKAANVSLVIGAGSGYNLKSNPLPEEEKLGQRNGESRRRNIFQEQLRAECESFKAVFDKRKQRISGLNVDEE